MDAAVAALVGAGIGAAGGAASSIVPPILTARADHKRHRREIYVTALANLRQVQNAMDLMLDAEGPTSSESIKDIDLYRRGAEIALIGAGNVRDSFNRAMDLVRDWSVLADAAAAPVFALGATGRRPFSELLEQLGDEIRELERLMRADAEMLM